MSDDLSPNLKNNLRVSDHQVLIENLPQIFFMADFRGKITYFNSYWYLYTGMSQKDSFSKAWWEKIIYPDDFLKCAKSWLVSINLKKSFQIECRLRRGGDESYRWHLAQAYPVYDKSGKVNSWVGTCIDIHETKVAEIESMQLANIVASSEDGIISKNLDGVITSWNTGAEKLYGYKASEIVGKSVSTIFPENIKDEFAEIMEVIKLGEAVDHHQTIRRKKDGQFIDVSVTISPLRDLSGNIIGASTIARDISQLKELERRKDAFIGMASHELKTPITTIKAFVQILQKSILEKKFSSAEIFLSRIDDQLNRLVDLISDLLDLSKIEAGKLELNKEKFELNQLISQTIENMHHLYPSYSINYISGKKVSIYADKNRLEQVLINLITNAIKYSPENKEIEVSLEKKKNKTIVSVKDFGIGISKSDQERVFERFFRAEGISEKTFPGLGIGLYISSEIVKRHGGNILVESKKGEGSTFTFVLPLK